MVDWWTNTSNDLLVRLAQPCSPSPARSALLKGTAPTASKSPRNPESSCSAASIPRCRKTCGCPPCDTLGRATGTAGRSSLEDGDGAARTGHGGGGEQPGRARSDDHDAVCWHRTPCRWFKGRSSQRQRRWPRSGKPRWTPGTTRLLSVPLAEDDR